MKFIDKDGTVKWALLPEQDSSLVVVFCPGQKLHREDTPAVIWGIGPTGWYLNGEKYREEGPVILYPSGHTYELPKPSFPIGSGSWE
jgi:hypothetical protein